MDWQPRSIEVIKDSVQLLTEQKKLKGPFDYGNYIYLDLLKAVRPQSVKVTELPK